MGRKAKDTTLHQLANDLREVEWEADHDHHRDEAEELLNIGELRNVYLMKDGKTFAVRLYCCGGKHVIGFSKDLVAACRFADMARMKFWIYRTRDCREPVESDLNFEVQSAKDDLRNELQAIQLLNDIQKHFVDIGSLKADEAGNIVSTKNPDSKPEHRRTVRDEFLIHVTRLEERLATVQTQQKIIIDLVEAAVALFKRNGISPQHVDTIDAEIVKSDVPETNTATLKEPLKPVVDPAVFDQAHGLTPIGANSGKDITDIRKPLVFLSEGVDDIFIPEQPNQHIITTPIKP